MLLLECKADETVVKCLGRVRRDCRHLDDKGEVCNWLKRHRDLLAMIDEDPRAAQPLYLQQLRPISDQHGILHYRDDVRGHRVLILKPRLEEWLIAAARESGIRLGDFGLSERGNDFHKEVNSRLPAVERLIKALEESASPRIAHLRQLLQP